MRTYLAWAAACLAPAMALAQAVEQEVTATVELAGTPAAVWDYAGDFHDLTWHPAVHSQTGEGGAEPGATRLLVLGEAGGPTIAEELTGYDAEEMRYEYRITDVAVAVLPVTNYASDLSVAPREGGGSVVTWHGTFRRGEPGPDPSPSANDEAAIAAVRGIYEAGLGALAERFGAPGS